LLAAYDIFIQLFTVPTVREMEREAEREQRGEGYNTT
jgi:hypothetical protein